MWLHGGRIFAAEEGMAAGELTAAGVHGKVYLPVHILEKQAERADRKCKQAEEPEGASPMTHFLHPGSTL